jgi:hypothetical protein
VPDDFYEDDDRMDADNNPHNDAPNDTTLTNG